MQDYATNVFLCAFLKILVTNKFLFFDDFNKLLKKLVEMEISFLGGTSTVTGSKHLVEYKGRRLLLDCGLFQGLKELRLLNRMPLPVNPSTIEAVILSHGHLDHVGYLPLLVKNGFKGHIYCTTATKAIAKVILLDSAKIQVEEAIRARAGGYSRHSDPQPLYDTEDARRVFPLFREVPFGEQIDLGHGVTFRLTPAGHILGASVIHLFTGSRCLVYTGDLGRYSDFLLPPPADIQGADVLLIESTYGHTLHRTSEEQINQKLIHHLRYAAENNSLLLIPGFVVERAQVLMYLIGKLMSSGQVPKIRAYVDSPMATAITDVFTKYSDLLKISAQELYRTINSYDFVENKSDSDQIVRAKFGRVVVAGGGMLSGGRALSYLYEHLENPNSTLLLSGYQAEGTRGRALQSGLDEIKIFGKYLKVKMRVDSMDGLSSHADRGDILRWLNGFSRKPTHIYIVHGEAHASDSLRLKLKDTFPHARVQVPRLGDKVEIGK
ncbi:metallo-beta-lactamase family protein [Schleiferia thermophila]|uniref:Metallo-beta-lactamase family protein n=2 Tax=Schleiferia thermophila TaxID=884107 RepID=A0A369A7V6_9FLAO|nr:metallo-beta-lactamase family protein [Schleiferia thermophila]GCD79104.1 MBL fold metallo-hydrolase [Schleiferia thermophila]